MRHTPSEPDEGERRTVNPASRQGTVHRAIAMVGISYAVDTLLLAGYCVLGRASWSLLALYALAATLQCVGFHRLIVTGWSLRFRDPSLAAAQMTAGSAIQVAFIAAAPAALPVFAFAAFTLVAFGTLQLTMRNNLMAWAGIAVGVATAFAAGNERFDVPTDTPLARGLLVASFLLALLRCSLIGSFGLRIREAIHRRQLLAEASALKLSELAHRDPLTGALNRRGIMEALESARTRARDGGPGFSIAMIDLDHFKRVNDAHGHLVGDEVLKTSSQCISGALRVGDVMGRFGGEEFLVILHGLTDAEPALRAVERVQRAFAEQPWAALIPGLVQTASIGVSAHREGERIEAMLARADAALYRCKEAGRNVSMVG